MPFGYGLGAFVEQIPSKISGKINKFSVWSCYLWMLNSYLVDTLKSKRMPNVHIHSI